MLHNCLMKQQISKIVNWQLRDMKVVEALAKEGAADGILCLRWEE
uniref:Uncharacterized protein n=1 Tax=Picea sitchensis TaxID=3332 RepID=A9NT11_PICSI|nr:unknown [Picea sitchensis]